jgi:isochorismate pyruvate lyase
MMKRPDECETMQDIRAEIDRLDAALIAMLAERATYIDRAAAVKTEAGLPARINARVEQVVANVRAEAKAQGLAPDLAEALWRQLIEWSIAREETLLGTAGPKETK